MEQTDNNLQIGAPSNRKDSLSQKYTSKIKQRISTLHRKFEKIEIQISL